MTSVGSAQVILTIRVADEDAETLTELTELRDTIESACDAHGVHCTSVVLREAQLYP